MYDSSHDEESPPPPLEQQGGEHEWYNSRFGIGKGTAGKSKYPSKAKQNRMRNTRNKDKDDDYDGGGLKCGGLKDVVEEGGNYAMVTTAGNFRSSTISALGMSGLFLDPKNVLDDLNKTANEYDEYEAQAIIIEEEEEVRQQQQLQLQQQQQQQQQQRKISSSSTSNRNIKKKIIQGQIERDKELKELEDVVLNYKHDHKEQEEEEQRSRESSRDHQEQKQRGLLKIASSPISKQQSKSDDYDDDDDDGTDEENNSSAVVVVVPVESKMMSRHTKKRIMEMKIYYTIGIIIFITMCILFAYGGYIIYRNKQS